MLVNLTLIPADSTNSNSEKCKRTISPLNRPFRGSNFSFIRKKVDAHVIMNRFGMLMMHERLVLAANFTELKDSSMMLSFNASKITNQF